MPDVRGGKPHPPPEIVEPILVWMFVVLLHVTSEIFYFSLVVTVAIWWIS
jgi:hypothetical protein